MTKGQWTLIGLLIVQLAMVGALHKTSSSISSEPRPLIPSLDTASVTRIEVTSDSGDSIVVTRADASWQISSADGYPADGAKVRELLDKISGATVRTPVVTSSKYHESLEVADGNVQTRIRLFGSDASKPLADLLVGKTTTGGAHVRLAGENEVFDVRDFGPWAFRPDTATWMQKKLVDVPVDAVTRISITNTGGTFALENVDGVWSVSEPDESKGLACTKDKVEPIVRAVASLNASGAGGKLDPATQGLGDDATVATLQYGEGSITVRIGGPVPDKNGQVYVTRDGFGFAATQWETSLNSVRNANLEELLEQ